jgi:molybdate transport system substrate-binding protein
MALQISRRLLLAGVLVGPVCQAFAAPDPLIVFAAASLKTPLEQLARSSPTPYVVSLGASGLLARQISAGAPAAIFCAADPKWIDTLVAEGKLQSATRVTLARNELVVIAPRRRARALSALSELPNRLGPNDRWVTADPKAAPLGAYAMEALKAAGIDAALNERVAFAQDAPSAVQLTARGGASFGIVYATDAALSNQVKVIARIPTNLHRPILYEAALVAGAAPGAKEILAHWRGPKAVAVFKSLGFLAPS